MELRIVNRYSTPSYSQSNGQVEATNKSIVNGLKKRLGDSRSMGRRASEHAMGIPDHSTGKTHFSMKYGVEAVISVETGLPTSRIDVFEVEENDQLLCKHLDLIEESHDVASVRLANH